MLTWIAPLARLAPAAAATALLAACATQGYPYPVHAGDTRDDVVRLVGPPTATFTMPDGHARLEYNHMPMGKQTFMVDFDAAGRVSRWENVLDENHFAAIVEGLGQDDVRRLIGPPTTTWQYHRPTPGFIWMYRYETIQRCVVFEVAFEAATGRVIDGSYPPDPGCPDEWY